MSHKTPAIWAQAELAKSRKRGIYDTWALQDAPHIEDGWLLIEFDNRKIYAPLEHPELPNQFAKLADGEDATLLKFVQTYGRLGWSELVTDEHDLDGEWIKARIARHRRMFDRTATDHEDGKAGEWIYGEPVDWIRIHAITVNWCLNAAKIIQGENTRKTDRLLNGLADSLPSPAGRRGSVIKRMMRERIRDKVAVRDFVGGMLEDYLWVNLRGVCRRVQYRKGRLHSVWGGNSLLESIYTLVTDAAVAGRMATCEACGTPFVQTDERQRYCPPREGQEKSPCMNRERVRRYRSRGDK
jgi:hypothetical protein